MKIKHKFQVSEENVRDLWLLCVHIEGRIESDMEDFPGGAVVKNLPANAGDVGSSPCPGISHMRRSN